MEATWLWSQQKSDGGSKDLALFFIPCKGYEECKRVSDGMAGRRKSAPAV